MTYPGADTHQKLAETAATALTDGFRDGSSKRRHSEFIELEFSDSGWWDGQIRRWELYGVVESHRVRCSDDSRIEHSRCTTRMAMIGKGIGTHRDNQGSMSGSINDLFEKRA